MAILRVNSIDRRKPGPGAVQDFSHPLSNGLYGHWLFNEGGGYIVRDIVNKNHGIAVNGGVTWGVENRYGKISNLPNGGGTSYRYNVPLINHNIGTGNFTWCIWAVRVADNGNAYEGLMSTVSGGNVIPAIYTEVNGTNLWGAYMLSTGAMPANTSLTLGKLYHLVIRRTGTTVDFWVDGIKEATTYTNSDSVPNEIMYFGTSLDSIPGNHSNCNIGGIRLYKRSLGEQEIKTLYRTPYIDIIDTSRYYGSLMQTTTAAFIARKGLSIQQAVNRASTY